MILADMFRNKRRSNPYQFGINLGCLEGVDTSLLNDVALLDGAETHPSDAAEYFLKR